MKCNYFFKYVVCFMCLLNLSAYAGELRVGLNGQACEYETIREAIDNAQANDIVYIMSGTYNELLGSVEVDLTFLPSEAAGPGFSGCEQEKLSATLAEVTIDGQGGSADTRGGLINISQGAEVTFRHMWLTNTNATYGGVIAVTEGSSLILDGALVSDGTATKFGGNVWVDGNSSFNMINGSTLYQGSAEMHGGGVALQSSNMYMSNGLIGSSSSSLSNHAGGHGGGIYANDSIIEPGEDGLATIQGNEADKFGGGIYLINSTMNMTEVSILNNTAGQNGGGLYSRNAEINFFDAIINNNTALTFFATQGGGGIYADNDSEISIRRSQVSNNSSNNMGGGVFAVAGTELNLLLGTSVENNVASNTGGGISTLGALSVVGGNIEGNSADSGGGVECNGCDEVSMSSGVLIQGNQAVSGPGGGMLIIQTSDAHVTQIIDVDWLNNQALSNTNGFGGAVAMNSAGTFEMIGGVFENNAALSAGGGFYSSTGSNDEVNLTFDEVNFYDNLVSVISNTNGGGALYAVGVDSINVLNSSFVNNSGTFFGGAIYSAEIEQFDISDSDFSSNQGNRAGAIYMREVEESTIKNTRFSNNESDVGSGGAIVIDDSIVNIINGQFVDNQSAFRAGAIYVGSSTLNIFADIGYGGGQCAPNELDFNVTGNEATQQGGVIYVENDSDVNISQTAVVGNSSSRGSFIYVPDSGSNSEVEVENLLIVENGFSHALNSTVEVNGENLLKINSATMAFNFGPPLQTNAVSVILRNSIIFNNSSAPEVILTNSFDQSCNNSQTPTNGSEILGDNLGDPLFDTSSQGHYRLSAASPSKDACMLTGPVNDLEGLYRNNGAHDQGAFELGGSPIDPDVIFIDGFEE